MRDLQQTRPTQVDTDAAFPVSGKARNIVTSGDNTGTPWIEDVINDRSFGWQENILKRAGIVPNGNPEDADNSQIAEAIERVSAVKAQGKNLAGSSRYGCTLTSEDDWVVDNSGAYWQWGGSFPKNVAAGEIPSVGNGFVVVINGSHNNLSDRNAVGSHDVIYTRNFNSVSDLILGYDSAGEVVDFSQNIGLKVSTGAGKWKILPSSSSRGIPVNGAKAIPTNGLWLDDFGADPNNVNFSDDALLQAHSTAVTLGGAKLRQGEGRYKFQNNFIMSGNGFHWQGSGQQSTWNDYYGTGTFISGNGFRCSISGMRIQDQGKQADTCIDESYMKECHFEDLEITTPFDDETGWLQVAINAVGTASDGNFTNDYQRVRVVGASGWGMILGQNSNAVTSHKLGFARCGLGSLRIDKSNGCKLDIQTEGSVSGKEVYIGDGAQISGLKLDIYCELKSGVSAGRALLVEGTAKVEGLKANINYCWGAVGGGYLGPDYGVEFNTSGGGYCFGSVDLGLVHGVQVAAVAANNSTDRVLVRGVRALSDFATGTSLPILDNKTSGASTSESLTIQGVTGNQSVLLPRHAVQPPRISQGSVWFSDNAETPFISIDGVGRNRLSVLRVGTTAQRPTSGLTAGIDYFDTTLGVPVWYNGSAWVDATGVTA